MEKTTRQKILRAAEKRFIDEGIASTQMKEIAEAVGINRRTLYRYFPTKDELAFEIEMIVMNQIQEYLALEPEGLENKTGYEKVEKYFDNVDFNDIKELMKFTAEFDRYFQDDYPTPQLEETFVRTLEPANDQLFQFIDQGRNDGTIRDDITTEDLFHYISQNFFALFQRLILREKHLKNEFCDQVDFQRLFKEISLSGIRK